MATKRQLKIKDEFASIAAAYPEEMLSCRDTGHHWTPSTATREANGAIRRILTCTACNTNRNQIIDRYGYIVSGSYTYTDGYIIPGVGRLAAPQRAALRLASALRSVD